VPAFSRLRKCATSLYLFAFVIKNAPEEARSSQWYPSMLTSKMTSDVR
jgi:hypothetical protein